MNANATRCQRRTDAINALARPSRSARGRPPLLPDYLRRDLAALSVLLALITAVAWDRLHAARELAALDNPTFYMPWWAHLGQRLRDGDIPAWLPGVFSGVPFAGDPQSGWMYLPVMAIFTILPAVPAFSAFVVFHLILGSVATYALARTLGLGALGSLTAAVAFVFGPFLKYSACCAANVQVTAWVPLSLLGAALALRTRSWRGQVGGWSLAGFALSQELSGWLGQGAYYGLLVLGGYIAYRTLLQPEDRLGAWRTRIARLTLHGGAVLGFGFGLAAAGVLPRLDAIARSTRAGGDTPRDFFLELWTAGYTLDRLLSVDGRGAWYVGGSVAVLAVLAPFLSRHRHDARFFVGLTLVSFLLAMRDGPLHRLLFVLLPRFEPLHGHSHNRILMVQTLGTAMLAGIAIDALVRGRAVPRRVIVGAVALMGLLSLRTMTISPAGEEITAITYWAMGAVSLLLAGTVVLATRAGGARERKRTTGRSVLLAFIIVVITWDLIHPWWGASIAGPDADRRAEEIMAVHADTVDPDGAGGFLASRATVSQPFRYFGYESAYLAGRLNALRGYRVRFRNPRAHALLVNNRAITLGLEDIQGYNPVQISRYAEFMTALNGGPQEYHEANVVPGGLDSPLLDLLNVRYIVVPNRAPPGRPDLVHLRQRFPTVYADGRVVVLENADALPRAWIVRDVRTLPTGEALPLLASGAVDPRLTVLLEEPISLPVSETAAGEGDTVSFSATAGDQMSFNVHAADAGMLVVSASYDPGWRAYVDGERVPLYVADHALQAVPIPAGNHTVELRYEPTTLTVGLWISGGTLLAIIALFIFAPALERRWRRTISSPAHRPPIERPSRPLSPVA